MQFLYLAIALFLRPIALGNSKENDERDEVKQLTARLDYITMDLDSIRKDLYWVLEFLKIDNKFEQISRKMEGKLGLNVQESHLKNDSSLEERVVALETQMTAVNEELTTIIGNVEDLDQQVKIAETQIVLIKSDQVLQDQKIFELEADAEILETNVQVI